MNTKLKVMIFHNMATPYRLPLFEELSKKYNLIVYFGKEKSEDRKWSTKLNNYSFKYKILPHKDYGSLITSPNLNKELIENKFNVCIVGDNPESFLQSLKIMSFCKKNNNIFIFWSGATLYGREYYYKLLKSMTQRLFFKIKKLIEYVYLMKVRNVAYSYIAYSKATSEFFSKHGISMKKVFIGTQNYPECLLSSPSWKKKPKRYRNKKVILSVGYLSERKGVDYLIKAFNNIKKRDTMLLIAGSGDQEAKLKELAKGNPNIEFLGYKEGLEKADYYSIADFFIFPTLYDVWGHVVTEALYYGLPVICSNKAEAKELLEEGKTGLIIPDQNVEALAEAMKKLLDNPQLLKKMKENVRKIPKSRIVDIETSVNTFEKAINYAIKHKK